MRRLLRGLLPLVCCLGLAQASATDDLQSALVRARTFSAKGQATVTVNFPPRNPPTRTVAKLPAVAFRPALIAKNFNVVAGAGENVAGRPTTRFDLTPKLSGAAGWTLWVDQVWNVPLAFEERGADGTLVRQAIFQSVQAKLVNDKRPLPAVPAGLRAAVLAALPGLKLPQGFTPVAVKQVAQRWEITLSDGANTLALITAPRNVKAAAGVASRQVGTRFVWLVGSLPNEALAAALANIKQIDETGLGTFWPAPASNP